MIMLLKELILKYITAFNNKDLHTLKSLFDKDVHLKDWEIDSRGIENVIKANKEIFNSAPKLKVKIDKWFFFENTAICILKVKIDAKNIIDVVDIIKVNENFKIYSVRAYKG